MKCNDVLIVGGGIIGLATAYQLSRTYPQLKLQILEKEAEIAQHQTGHNSGVLHSGIYYKPGSLKAINCREGKKQLEAFCQQEEIDFEICGKVIIALSTKELPALEDIFQRGKENGVLCEMITKERLHELEPHVNGIKAIYVPETGIINYQQVCQRLAQKIRQQDHQITCLAEVHSIAESSDRLVVETTAGSFEGKYLINCAGLYSDKITALTRQAPQVQIIPFRGEYYAVRPEKHYLCRNLIYPVPDPEFPFLGVHFTRMIEGGLECGPNAVFAFAREGYTRSRVNVRELKEALSYRGFHKLAARYWKVGLGEIWRSFRKPIFTSALQRLIPEIQAEDLYATPAGVRAQAVTPEGKLVDDFLIQESPRILNVCNAPSPAATASLNIGKILVDRLATQF